MTPTIRYVVPRTGYEPTPVYPDHAIDIRGVYPVRRLSEVHAEPTREPRWTRHERVYRPARETAA